MAKKTHRKTTRVKSPRQQYFQNGGLIMKNPEICNECGRDVSWGSGLFVNRVLDFDDYKTRKEIGKPFPEGDYICRECEAKLNSLGEQKRCLKFENHKQKTFLLHNLMK